MTNYQKFLESKQKQIIKSGFNIHESELNSMLFDFQKFTVQRALKAGKYAIFANTGQGKTPMQLSISNQILRKINKPVLILAPLAVTGQTIEEGIKFNIPIKRFKNNKIKKDIYISNYEQLKNIDIDKFGCICLDESSILKNETGSYRNLLIEKCKNVPYKFCFSATPSPNDPMELGNHSEFLDVMTYNEMLAMYFVHDTNRTSKWRIKGHAVSKFYEFVSNWAIMYSHPKDIGFEAGNFDLPKLEIIEKQIITKPPNGTFFSNYAVNATDYHKTLRETEKERIKETLSIVKTLDNQPIIIWTKQNPEANTIYTQLKLLGYNCRNVQGSDSSKKKQNDLLGFAYGDFQILITKEKIASMGLNYQHCHYQIFNSIDFSFEQTYQAMRRSWRFGQINKVTVWMITTDRMQNVIKTQQFKHKQFKQAQYQMIKAVNKNLNNKITTIISKEYDVKTNNYWLMYGDCVTRIKEIPNNSIDLMVFSPPFADLYTYSNHIEDMGNVIDYQQFVDQFKFLAKEIKRVIKPGRIVAIHCMDLPLLKSREGFIGIRRFSSMIGDIFEGLDMFLHSEFTIWKDPLLAAVRTKTIGLAHRQLLKDSSIIRAGLPDKILCFKTKEENKIPITKKLFTHYIPMHKYDTFPQSINEFKKIIKLHNRKSAYSIEEQYSHQVWQRYASPIWMDINQTNTLQRNTARSKQDEKHICPLQLEVIERLILLYSNEKETILSPFGGIGSEGFQALLMNRKSISIELKESYFNLNIKNHKKGLMRKQLSTFFD